MNNKCENCGCEVEYDEVQYGVCVECFDEFTNDLDLMLAYADKYEKDFYAEFCYGVTGDYFQEALSLFKREIQKDISLNKKYALDFLREFCLIDTYDYIEFCIKEMNK